MIQLKTKICSKCTKEKSIIDFSIRVDTQKKRSECKDCRKKLTAKWARDYRKKFPWMDRFRSCKDRCENPKTKAFKYYGGKGIKLLMDKNDFKYLWFRDKAHEMQKPSIDRINSNGHYELNNCRFIEQSENCKRSAQSRLTEYQKLYGMKIREMMEAYGHSKNFYWRKHQKGILKDFLSKKLEIERNR